MVNKSSFSLFLKKNYGYTDIRQFSPHKRFASSMNSIFLAKDTDGKDIFIKSCRYGDMSENEYLTGLELWRQAPDNFAKPLAYFSGKKFSFCSSEYIEGKDLYAILSSGEKLTGVQKSQMVEDLYTIIQAMQRANIVHRDANLKNMLYHNGRVVLIDCQLATKIGSTQPISFFDNILKLCLWRSRAQPGKAILEWDDTERILSAIRTIGTDDEHRERFDLICAEIGQTAGKYKYTHPYPSIEELNRAIKVSRIKSHLHLKKRMRSRYCHIIELLQFLKKHHPEIEQTIK